MATHNSGKSAPNIRPVIAGPKTPETLHCKLISALARPRICSGANSFARVGIVGGYFRGRVDGYLGRFTDFLLAFPAFFMIVALSEPMVDRIEKLGVAEGNGARILFLILFLSFFGWPGFSRLIRSQVMSIREREFVTAAQAMGASRWRIISKELIPNLWAPVIAVGKVSSRII